MRRNVRYTPLGRVRRVTLLVGMDHAKREAEIVDESVNGYGFRVKDASGIVDGQPITIEGPKGKVQGTVVRLETMGNGTFQVGVQINSNLRPI